MQVPFDQNAMMPTAPMLKVATKAVYVPSSCVGIVIGRSGETIRDLQQRSGAHIKVTPDKDAQDDAPLRVIYISGTPEALELAQWLVNDVINEGLTRSYRDGVEPRATTDVPDAGSTHSPNFEGGQGKPSDGNSAEEQTSQSQRESEDTGDSGVDAGQATLEEQRDDSGPTDTIDYADAEKFPELGVSAKDEKMGGPSSKTKKKPTSPQHTGPEEGNTKARAETAWTRGEDDQTSSEPREIRDSRTTESSQLAPFTGEGRLVQRPATDYPSASITFEMKIPHAKVGVIIGKNGSTIRSLQQKSGARIVVSKKIDTTREDNPRAVLITGPEPFVDTARRLIVQKINPPSDDQAQTDEKDTPLETLEIDDSLLSSGDQPSVESLATDLANQSLSAGNPLSTVIPGSPAPVSSMRASQTNPYGPYQRPLQFATPGPVVPFSGVPPYQGVRSVGRPDATEFRRMDPQSQQQPQYGQFVGQVPQGYTERVQVPQGFPFAQNPESNETMQPSVGEFRQDQLYPQGANIFGGLSIDGTGSILAESGAPSGQGYNMSGAQEFGGDDPIHSYQVGDFEQHGTEPASTA